MPVHRVDSPEAEAALRAIEARRNASEAEALRVADAFQECAGGERLFVVEQVVQEVAGVQHRLIAA